MANFSLLGDIGFNNLVNNVDMAIFFSSPVFYRATFIYNKKIIISSSMCVINKVYRKIKIARCNYFHKTLKEKDFCLLTTSQRKIINISSMDNLFPSC